MTQIGYKEAEKLASKYGIRTVRSEYVKSAADAVRFARNRRIVLKAIPEAPTHKSKSGLVATGLEGPAIVKAFGTISARAKKFGRYSMLAQDMLDGGIEIIMGGKKDAQFGKMVLIGLGGIYVEAFRDFALRLCPISRRDAADMLSQLRSKGVIAPDAKSEELITSLVMKVARMYSDTDIEELDLNPVILHDGTYDAVDLRMIR